MNPYKEGEKYQITLPSKISLFSFTKRNTLLPSFNLL
jgi:hypothetical protein